MRLGVGRVPAEIHEPCRGVLVRVRKVQYCDNQQRLRYQDVHSSGVWSGWRRAGSSHRRERGHCGQDRRAVLCRVARSPRRLVPGGCDRGGATQHWSAAKAQWIVGAVLLIELALFAAASLLLWWGLSSFITATSARALLFGLHAFLQLATFAILGFSTLVAFNR